MIRAILGALYELWCVFFDIEKIPEREDYE